MYFQANQPNNYFGYQNPLGNHNFSNLGGTHFLNNSTASNLKNLRQIPGIYNRNGGSMRTLSKLAGKKGFNLSSFLSTSQKFLGTINQVMPIYYQVKPIINNARVFFKVARAVNKEPLAEVKDEEQTSENLSSNNNDQILDAHYEEIEKSTPDKPRKKIQKDQVQPPFYTNF